MKKKQIIENAIQDFTYSNTRRFDRRRTAIRTALQAGLSEQIILLGRAKMLARMRAKIVAKAEDMLTHDRRVAFLKMVNKCEFDLSATSSRYNMTGVDWCAYHRPSSAGGWVLIAPDEPGNNWHTTDPVIVKYLTAKFCIKG